MKTLLVSLLVTVSVGVSGCGDSRAGEHAHADHAPAATYKAGHGVQLTPAGRTFVGLETGEVESRSLGGSGSVAAIPKDALLRTVRGDFVYVTNGEWFLRTPVVVGVSDATHLEIRDGLYEGDTIVTKGVRALSLSEIQALNGGVGCADGH